MMSFQNPQKIGHCQERVATEWGLATAVRAVVALAARLFALPPGPPGRLFGTFGMGQRTPTSQKMEV